MRVLVAIDSFKGSLSSVEAGNAVKEAILRLDSNAAVVVKPLADGGEGTVAALSCEPGAQSIAVAVTGPLGAPVEAKYCILRDGTAVLEMAAAAGLPLVPQPMRDPMHTTSYGVGQLILDAIGRGCRRFIIGIGGSATNDGGVGMLAALGFRFTDAAGRPIAPGAKGLEALHAIDVTQAHPALAECTFRIACDVKNPLCGPQGCSYVFAPQKGAAAGQIPQMDAWLAGYASLAKAVSAKADPDHPGAGAAGGLGFAFLSFTNATLESGVAIILSQLDMEAEIQKADIVVTGEGRLDAQTVMGKAPIGVAKLAKQYGKTVIAFSGCATPEAEICNAHGIDAYFPILQEVVTLEEALEPANAYRNLRTTATQVFRLLAK